MSQPDSYRLTMHGDNLTQRPSPPHRMDMLTTVEKFQRMRQQKQQLPLIFPIEGKQIFDPNRKRSRQEQVYSKDQVYPKQQVHYNKYSIERNPLDNDIGESSSLQILTKMEGILQRDLLRFTKTTSKFPDIAKKRSKHQELQDLRAKHLNNLRARVCTQMSTQIEGKRHIYSYRSAGAQLSTSPLSVAAHAIVPVPDQTKMDASVHINNVLRKRDFKSMEDVAGKDSYGNYSDSNIYSDTAHIDYRRDVLLEKDLSSGEESINFSYSVTHQLNNVGSAEIEKKQRPRKKIAEISAVDAPGHESLGGTQTSNRVTIPDIQDDVSRNNRLVSVRSLRPLLGNGCLPNTGDDSDDENTDLIVTSLPPIHEGRGSKNTRVRTSKNSLTALNGSEVSESDTAVQFILPNGAKDWAGRDLEPRNPEYVARVDNLVEPRKKYSPEYVARVDNLVEPRKRYRMHIVINIPYEIQGSPSPEPDFSYGNDSDDQAQIGGEESEKQRSWDTGNKCY